MVKVHLVSRYTVDVDVYIARRKRMHVVLGTEGVPLFHAAHLMDVFVWLAEKGTNIARFTDDAESFDVVFTRTTPVSPEKEST